MECYEQNTERWHTNEEIEQNNIKCGFVFQNVIFVWIIWYYWLNSTRLTTQKLNQNAYFKATLVLKITKVNIQHECIGSLHNNFGRFILKCVVHVTYCVTHQRTDLFCIVLQLNQKKKIYKLWILFILNISKLIILIVKVTNSYTNISRIAKAWEHKQRNFFNIVTLYFVISSSMFVLRPGYLRKNEMHSLMFKLRISNHMYSTRWII